MSEIIICVGISGSGKSTWSTSFIKDNSKYLRINRDDIRKTLVGDLDGYYQKSNLQQFERIVNNLEDKIFDQAIGREFNIIVDNTNLKQEYINRWLNMVNFQNVSYGFEYNVKFKLFDVSLEEAKERVSKREGYYDWEFGEIYNEDLYKLEYIDKQFEDYQKIKEFILTNYKDQIV